MAKQQEYYTFTKDVKTLIQYVQEQAIDHSVVEAANRLNWAIKKDLKGYGIPVTPAKERKLKRLLMKKANITLTCHLWVDCPYCRAVLDLANDEYNYEYNTKAAIFAKQSERLYGKIITCECCNSDFELGEVYG